MIRLMVVHDGLRNKFNLVKGLLITVQKDRETQTYSNEQTASLPNQPNQFSRQQFLQLSSPQLQIPS